MSARITYIKRDPSNDYVDARWDVLLDGEKIGEVTRNRTSRVETYAGKMYGRSITATEWECEAPQYRSYLTSRTRMDAVIDLLKWRGMNETEARATVGKRSVF